MTNRYGQLLATFIWLPFLLACGKMEYSPWQSNAPMRHLNDTNLARLLSQQDASLADAPVRFALIGDTQKSPQEFRAIIDRIAATQTVDFIVLAGDITEMGLRREYAWMGGIIAGSPLPVVASATAASSMKTSSAPLTTRSTTVGCVL